MRTVIDTSFFQNFFEGPLDEENVILTLYPVNEEIIEDHQVEPGVSSTSEVKEEALNTNNQCMKTTGLAQFAAPPTLGSPGKVSSPDF